MSTSNIAADHQEAPRDDSTTVVSPTKAPGSAPSKKPSFGPSRTERPTEPPASFQRFLPREAATPIGNPKAITALRHEGQLGIFYDRVNTTRIPTTIPLDLENIRSAVTLTLGAVIQHEIAKTLNLDVASINVNTTDMTNILADGIMVMIYSKLRVIHYLDQRYADRFRIKPKVPVPFEIPVPYALAISQLGLMKISSLTTELYLAPGGPQAYDTNFGIRENQTWSPVYYARIVETAKKIGLQFTTVDLSVKMGSSWWLYRSVPVGTTANLECPYPEDNFTENTAALATLFSASPDGVHNPIVDQDALGAATFGTMARQLPAGIALNTYYAISAQPTIDFKVAK